MAKNGMEKDMIKMEKYINKLMEKVMLKNIIMMVNWNLKVNILMEKKMEKEKNIIMFVN